MSSAISVTSRKLNPLLEKVEAGLRAFVLRACVAEVVVAHGGGSAFALLDPEFQRLLHLFDSLPHAQLDVRQATV